MGVNEQEQLSKLLHEGLVKGFATTGNISFNIAGYLIENGVRLRPHWIQNYTQDSPLTYTCSNCANIADGKYRYCPNCGERMNNG